MLSPGAGTEGAYEKEATGGLFDLAVKIPLPNNARKVRVPMIITTAMLMNRNLTDSLLPSAH
jgi:hypothetical protein